MRYLIAFLLLVVVLAAPAAAGIKGCNATMVNQNLCDDTTQDLLSLKLAGTARAGVAAALAHWVGWTANVVCTQAMIDAGTCLIGQLGRTVPNPETRPQAATRALQKWVQERVISDQAEEHRTTKNQELQTLLNGIGTPDVRP